MKILIQATKNRYPIRDLTNKERAQRISKLNPKAKHFTPQVAEDIEILWQDEYVKLTFEKREEFALSKHAKYYIDEIARLASPDYVPTEKDVRKLQPSEIKETRFSFGGLNFRAHTISENQQTNKKWIHLFQGCTAIIYVVSLADYDQEGPETNDDSENEEEEKSIKREKVSKLNTIPVSNNRLMRALQLFGEVCNSRWFNETPILLFLNNTTELQNKLSKSPLSKCFPDYYDGDNFDSALSFIFKKFCDKNQSEMKQIYSHFSANLETEEDGPILIMYNANKDIILKNNLRLSGFL